MTLKQHKELLSLLSKERNPWFRQILGKMIVEDKYRKKDVEFVTDWEVRYRVAGNTNTPEDILRKLSEDKDLYVRCGVAENTNDKNILIKLSED